jgi:hypothetical protein
MSADDRSLLDSAPEPTGTSTQAPAKPSNTRRRSGSKPSPEQRKAARDAQAVELAERLIATLHSHRSSGGNAQPMRETDLAQACSVGVKQAVYRAAIHTKQFTSQVALLKFRKPRGSNQPSPPTWVAFKDDLANPDVVKRLVASVIQALRVPSRQIYALNSLNLRPDCSKEARATLSKTLARIAAESPLDPPPKIGFLRSNATVYAFLLEDVIGAVNEKTTSNAPPPAVPQPSPPLASASPSISIPTDFAEAFRQAFTRLDRRNGGTNFVRLLELRQALPQFDRATFDAGLNQLRRQWEFSLEAHEGLHVQISPEERESGIPEMGTLLIYVSRR